MRTSWMIGIIAILVIGFLLLIFKKTRKIGKIVLTVWVSIASALVIGFVRYWLIHFNYRGEAYSVLAILFGIFLAITLVFLIWGSIKKKKVYLSVLSAGLALLIAAFCVNGYFRYEESVPEYTSYESLKDDYAPHNEHSKVVILSEESTLKITEDFPRMAGAEILYPLYCAFACAVYPQEQVRSVHFLPFIEYTEENIAFYDLYAGEIDIAFVTQTSGEAERSAKDYGTELVYTPICKEALVFFTNSENPIETISVEEIRNVYSGEVTRWSELGVKGLGKIRPYQRRSGSVHQGRLVQLMGDLPLIESIQEKVVFDDYPFVVSRSAEYRNFKNALGYCYRFYYMQKTDNEEMKVLSVNGVEPTIENVKNGTYPLTYEFYAVTRKDSGENVQKLLEWILSPQGQTLIERTGYTPIK